MSDKKVMKQSMMKTFFESHTDTTKDTDGAHIRMPDHHEKEGKRPRPARIDTATTGDRSLQDKSGKRSTKTNSKSIEKTDEQEKEDKNPDRNQVNNHEPSPISVTSPRRTRYQRRKT